MSLKPRSVHQKYSWLRVLPHKTASFNDNPCFRNFVWHEYWPFKGFTGTAVPTFLHSLPAVPNGGDLNHVIIPHSTSTSCQEKKRKKKDKCCWRTINRKSLVSTNSARTLTSSKPYSSVAWRMPGSARRPSSSIACRMRGSAREPSSSVAWRMCESKRKNRAVA